MVTTFDVASSALASPGRWPGPAKMRTRTITAARGEKVTLAFARCPASNVFGLTTSFVVVAVSGYRCGLVCTTVSRYGFSTTGPMRPVRCQSCSW